ncbi:hypothetical protein [Streptomyces sp. NPDC058964]|uniref:hypothetical protein n=1 Tax=Streptomyces sp. NPDC058964 TaxID=3346681 RepID=UPI00367AA925
MTRLKGGAITAVVMTSAVAGCTVRQTEGSSGPGGGGAALTAAGSLTVEGRAPKTGYARTRFGTAWTDTDTDSCGTRVVPVLRGTIAGFSQLVQGAVRHAC